MEKVESETAVSNLHFGLSIWGTAHTSRAVDDLRESLTFWLKGAGRGRRPEQVKQARWERLTRGQLLQRVLEWHNEHLEMCLRDGYLDDVISEFAERMEAEK